MADGGGASNLTASASAADETRAYSLLRHHIIISSSR